MSKIFKPYSTTPIKTGDYFISKQDESTWVVYDMSKEYYSLSRLGAYQVATVTIKELGEKFNRN